MTETVEVILCNRALGTQKEPVLYGTCTKNLGHAGGCSSPELRKFRREATAKTRAKQRKAPAPVVDSLDDNSDEVCACGHTFDTCPNPKFCGLTRTQIEERQKQEAEEAAYQAQQQAARVRKAEEERFIGEILNRVDAGEMIEQETQKEFLNKVIDCMGLPTRFSLARDERIRRGLDVEARLSEVLYGPSYTMIGEPPCRLDERSLHVRLGRFLQVEDLHGWLNVAHRQHPSHKPAITPGHP